MKYPVNCNTTRRLFIAQEGCCFYCKGPLTYADSTRDHFVPKSILREKGWTLKYNFVLAHAKCNSKKQNRWPTQLEVQKFKQVYKKAAKLKG